MNKLLMVMVLGASAVAASAQGLQPRRTLGSRLARPRPQPSEGVVGKEAVKVILTAREGGTTWKYKESDKPLTNWGDLSFDDKDWKEGVSGFGNSYGLRRTVWSGGANDLYLRKTFSMSSTTGQIERVTLTYAIDDDIEVLLNGSQLFSLKARRAAKYGFTDVTKEFKCLLRDSGQDNVLAVKAHDVGGGAYVDVGVDIVLADSASVPKKDASVSAEKSAETQGFARVSEIALIPFGGTDWKYKMQGEVEENWKRPDFNDASWANGKAPFGNRDDYVTSWTTPFICLRKKFDCPYEDADIKYLQIREGIDNMVDIWLNGSHIYHWQFCGNRNLDLTTAIPRRLWEGLLRRKDNVLTVLARDWGKPQYVNVGLTAMVRQSVEKELVCPTEYVPADMKLLFPATKLADIQVCSAVLTGDAVNWGRPTAVLASNIKSFGDLRKTLQFQRLEAGCLKCVCVELEQKGRDVWGRGLYCRSVEHCDVSGVDFDTLLCPTRRIIDNDSEISNRSGAGYGLRELTAYFASGENPNSACTGANSDLKRPGLLGGSLRVRRLQRQQEAQSAAAKQQAEEAAKDAERQAEVAAEKAQREAERAEQRKQLLLIQEELKRVKEAKAAAAKSECATSCVTNEPTLGKCVVVEKLGQCDFLLNKDFKKNAKFYLCLFSASWCGPCRAEMPRIAKTYAETLKDDPDIELIHFSRDQNDEKALAWAKEHDVKFPVVKPKGGNPLDLHSRGIPHLFIVKADGTLVEEGHPMKIFNEEKFREIKDGRMEPRVANVTAKENELTAEVDGYTWTYTMKNGTAVIGAITDGRCRMSERRCAISPNPTGHITIPSILNGVKVVGIGENALCGCKGIKSITIPEGVTCIGRCAFNRCEGLTGVKIPDSVTTIGEYSFDWCGSITNVTLGEGVTTIGSCAFRGCYGLTGIRIPKSVKKIENSAFIFSDKMKEFVVDEENENYTTMNGMILSRDGRKLHEGVNGDVLIPDGVTSVLAMAFCRRSGLKSVRLPNSVTNIDGFSFASCCALKSLRIPASVTSIGANAFGGCKELSSVTMCGERPELGKKAFDRCDSLKSIHVPATAKSWAGMKEWQGIPLVFDADGTASGVGDSTTACVAADKPVSGKVSVAEKLGQCDFLLNKDFKKNAKFYLCLFSASWCGPCRREMPRIAKMHAETLKNDPDIELIHFSRDQNDEKALAWAKEHDVKFPVVKPKGGNPLDLHSRGIPHLFIVKADGTLVEEGHPMRIFNEEKFRELKGGSIENAAANGEEEGSKEHAPNESFVLTGPYGIRMTGRADCKKDAEYVLKKLVDVYLPCAVRYYGDPFGGKTPSRVFTIDVQRKDGSDKGGRAGHPWGYQDGKFNIGLVKDGDRWDLAKDYYLIMAFRILTVCEEADWAGLTLYAGDFVWGDIDHDDPIPRIKEDIRKGFELARTGEKVTGLLWATRRYAPMWAALEELREKHSTLLLDYCNLKNSKYAKGELPQKISADQMVALMGEVTGEDVVAIFRKHGVGEKSSR